MKKYDLAEKCPKSCDKTEAVLLLISWKKPI